MVSSQDIARWDLPEPAMTPADFQRIKSWGLDSVEVHQSWNLIETVAGSYDENYLAKLDLVIDRIQAAGLNVILKIVISGWFAQQGGWISMEGLWDNPALQERFYSLWEMLVTRYWNRLSACILLNEPIPRSNGPWTDDEKQMMINAWNLGLVSDECIRRIRLIDQFTPLMMTYGPWGTPSHYANYGPRPFENIIYAFSWYMPHDVTHECAEWTGDQEWIQNYLAPVLEFRSRYGVPIWAQETGLNVLTCGASESRMKWVDDSLKVLNRNEIGWFYFIYSHWPTMKMSLLDLNGNDRPTVEILKANTPTAPINLLIQTALSAASGIVLILLSL